MIVCPACNHRNPSDALVCEACGGSLEHFVYRACPSCGALNPAENVFCHRCFDDLVPGSAETIVEASDIPVESFVPSEPSVTDREEAVREAAAPPVGERPTSDLILEADAEVATTAEMVSEETEPGPLAEPQQLVGEPIERLEAAPSEPEAPMQPSELIPEAEEDVLEGLEGLVPIAAAATQAHAFALPVPPSVSETEQHDAELFHSIASERGPLRDAARVVIPRRARLLSRRGRALLYLLVLLAALTPVFTGDRTSLLLRPRDSVTSLARDIQSLPTGSAVLISFDYGPAYAGEVDPLALAVGRHLAASQVRVVAMSTDPGGIGLAEHLYRTIAGEMPDYRYGESYAILGYLPGPEAGLRTLCTSLGKAFKVDYVQRRTLSELPVMKDLTSVQDFDQVIVFADDSRSVRSWIEQVQSQCNFSLHALVTAAIEPMLLPYQQSGQLSTLIAAAHSAGEYEKASGMEEPSLHWTDAYGAFCLVLLVTAIATNVAYLRTRARQRSHGQ